VGAVFTTEHPGDSSATWIIVDYAPEKGQISYARVAVESHAGLIWVQCSDSADGHTLATITYSLTALGEAGNRFLAHLSESHYREWMSSWESAINRFLAHAGEGVRG